MASNHKLVCARAARRQFGGAFQQAVRDYRGAKLAALTLARGLEERLPDARGPWDIFSMVPFVRV